MQETFLKCANTLKMPFKIYSLVVTHNRHILWWWIPCYSCAAV